MPMKQFDQRSNMARTADAIEAERHMSEAGLAAEYERLEAQLGAGMATITERPFTHTTVQAEGTARGQKGGLSESRVVHAVAKDAQEEAEKTGGIVAVAEVPVDISDLAAEGNEFDSRASLAPDRADSNETSYFFPPGRLHVALETLMRTKAD